MDLSKTPAAPPPPGVTPNFDNPEGSEYEIYSISIALCMTATLTLMGRLYTRAVILRAVGLDDWLCIGGQICAWIFTVLSIINIRNGYGVHIWDLHLDTLTPFKQYDLVEEDIYALGVWFVKTAILVFYLRLSPEKRFRQITYGIIAFVAIYTLVSLLIFTLPCRPIAATWDVTLLADAKCINQFDFVYANAAFNILSDLMALVLPIRLCWNLQATFKQKLLLMFLFAMGSFACVVAIIRVVTMMPFINSNDFTWFKVTLAKWCMVEINVGIICASLPALRPLLIRTRIFSARDMSAEPDSRDLPKSSRKKVSRSWNHITELDSQRTLQGGPEGDVESAIPQDGDNSESDGVDRTIVKSTDLEVSYEKDNPPRV
ncbi:uncharacterized protein BDW47DRAFT_109952 [Aspergillus candidus]|uniref:Rhodopsin domain-containing protein n=1 Tax=Aspergillus candidus TaxID=41067 RepID=A0A2I2F4V0_ASPCN|nr:hypothetical protein BDW47DRAFT_109952 [Aspergillus candidus]PLB35670.1 hypothetical protein BDW47DRAFT_109952 [Aspergillus candidus]